MNRLTSLVRRYPVASIAVVVAVAGVGFLLLTGRPQPPTGGAVVTPAPVASPVVPAPVSPGPPVATPAPVPTAAAAAPPSPAQAAGRADPFSPLVKAQVGGAPPAQPVTLPPPPPLPPPLFPGPGASPGQPGAPGPAPVARLSSGAQLIGVLGDTGRVAIIKIGNEVFIVAQGETIQARIRVELVDANAGLVILIEDGERVELRFG